MALPDPQELIGRAALDSDGLSLGEIEEVIVGRGTGDSEFAVIPLPRRGGIGRRLVAAPLEGASMEGDRVRLAVDGASVAHAPDLDADAEELSADQEDRLRAHYRLVDRDEHAAATRALQAEDGERELVVSEERLVVDTRRVATDRVRVRKVIVTEPVTLTVNVRREELRIEREPLAEGSGEERGNGDSQLSEGSLEFVLYAEEPVVETRVVPVERVRVARDEVVEEQEITEEVRRERIEFDQEEHAP